MSEQEETASVFMSEQEETVSDLARLWRDFKAGSTAARNDLMLHYAPLVQSVARNVKQLARYQSLDDLVNEGMLGLADALERFELDRKVKFETYAAIRVRGWILDELRSGGWAPRSARDKNRMVDAAIGRLHEQLGRTPTDADVAHELGITKHELRDLYQEMTFSSLVNLDEEIKGRSQWATGDEAEGNGNTLGDLVQEPVDPGHFDVQQIRVQLVNCIERLRARERVLLALYYYENLTLVDIGVVLGVGESRACQLHVELLGQLSDAMRV